MQWSDVTKPPPPKLLRQFAGLCLVVFGGWAAWRYLNGQVGVLTYVLAAFGFGVGTVGLVWPAAVRPIYTGWMIAAFPIGWAISRLVLAGMFYLVFTPVALLFRLTRRDALRLRRDQSSSHWVPKPGAKSGKEYFRQY